MLNPNEMGAFFEKAQSAINMLGSSSPEIEDIPAEKRDEFITLATAVIVTHIIRCDSLEDFAPAVQESLLYCMYHAFVQGMRHAIEVPDVFRGD